MDRFSEILYDLGKEIGVDLYPDENRICQLNFQDRLHIQLQYDEPSEKILIACFVCDVPPGKYREKLLKEALKSNALYPRLGTLGYSERNNKLTLFEYVHIPGLKGEKLFETLEAFIAKAVDWKEAVEGGKPLPTVEKKRGPDESMFGLKP